VTAYLHRRGVEVEKTTDFTILFLFSIGITKGKWGTLLNALLDFKRDYDRNAPLARCCRTSSPDTGHLRGPRAPRPRRPDVRPAQDSRQTHWLAEAFSTLPRRDDAERGLPAARARPDRARALDELADRVLATSVVPTRRASPC
jgi:arginine/lysine/ornithine decarboxylase